MEEKENLATKVKDVIKKITNRELKDQFKKESFKPPFNLEEETGESLDEDKYDEDDPLADV